jgi:hypothetical protein
MARCAYCKAETELFENGTPICVTCAGSKSDARLVSGESQIQTELLEAVKHATDRVNAAADSFSFIMRDIPSNLPPPDSTSRITLASRELSTARAEMMKAHRRLNEFLSRGVVPEDLKDS